MTARTKPRRKPAAKKPKRQQVPLIRTSERSLFKDCRWSWDHCYNERIKPVQEKPALRFGSLIHAALELRYPPGIKRGPHPAKTFKKLYQAQLTDAERQFGASIKADEEWEDAEELGVDMMERFVDEYGRDEEWKVIESEMTFKTPVHDPETDKLLFYYVGTMDGVWQNRMDGGIRIIDWKTTGNDPIKEAAGKGVLDEQATAYWTWGVDYLIEQKILKPRQVEALDGMLYCFLRKAKTDDRPQNADGYYLNKDGSVSKNQPLAYFHREVVYRSETEREHARARAVQEFVEMQMCKTGELAIYKTPSTGSMGHCGWCGYRDICELHEAGADQDLLKKSTMVPWDPYDAHEIEEEGKGK